MTIGGHSEEKKRSIPSRTEKRKSLAVMILCLKTWESNTLPGLIKSVFSSLYLTPFCPLSIKKGAVWFLVEYKRLSMLYIYFNF